MMDTGNPWLLHFTHVDNLGGIAEHGLLADGMRPEPSVECAQSEIKQRRRGIAIPVGPEGTVADYAPFYFAPRSPMLYRIHSGGVPGYRYGQRPLVYLVTRASRVLMSGLPWVASDRNAAVATARFTDKAEVLPDHIDWSVMDAEYWHNTPEDGSRVQRRMAEFLVHSSVPWETFTQVYTYDEEVAERGAEVFRPARAPSAGDRQTPLVFLENEEEAATRLRQANRGRV